GRPAPRNTGTGRRPANPQLLRQRLFVFVVVTLLVALGIAAAQGCQGPQRGLGGDGDDVVRQPREQVEQGYEPLDGDVTSDRYESTFDISE
ncbi:serine/threonine protein kinase, partial [Streptomyces sp. T21Q-yed]|nr:serine/threonine protein kinase [Streptomyces sp. T21Q-yed]